MTPTPIGGAILTLGFQMSELNPKTKTNKVSTRQYFILPAEATAYLEASNAAGRDSTLVGAFITATQAITLGVLKTIDVGMRYETALAPPASNVFAFDFDQILISSRDVVSTEAVKTSIPARKDSVLTPESDGVTIPITTTPMSTWVAAYEAIALSFEDNALNVLRAVISE